MIQIPIGEYFETFVRWLKSSFEGFFDLISDILDFSITVLEQTLLLDGETAYASVIFVLVLASMVGLLARRLGGAKGFIPAFLAALVVAGGAEIWRFQSLARTVDPELASSLQEGAVAVQADLKERAPESFDAALELIESIEGELEATGGEAPELEDALGLISAAQRDVRRARGGDYEDVYDALSDTAAAIETTELSLEEGLSTDLADATGRYRSYVLIEELDRLLDDLTDLKDAESPERRNEFLRARTYDELFFLLDQSVAYYAGTGTGPEALLRELKADVRLLNPERLQWYGPVATIFLLALIAYLIAGGGILIFTFIGLLVVLSMGLWIPTVESLALVLSATLFALVLGIPIGIGAARSPTIDQVIRPILDFMQTMPAFVYLIPAVIFFGLGKVPGAMATLIFAMPPAVRLTSLGIRQVPSEVVEAAQAFGATGRQLLFKAQLPIAMPTILAGVNQTIMLALSMVVIGGMIGAGGLGEVVLSGITQLKLGLGFEGGIAVVILAIYLDRVTQALGRPKSK